MLTPHKESKGAAVGNAMGNCVKVDPESAWPHDYQDAHRHYKASKNIVSQ